eukprot:934425-Karenia_brevis.AAC.1
MAESGAVICTWTTNSGIWRSFGPSCLPNACLFDDAGAGSALADWFAKSFHAPQSGSDSSMTRAGYWGNAL